MDAGVDAGFEFPDYGSDVDFDALILQTPDDFVIKGMFMSAVVDTIKASDEDAVMGIPLAKRRYVSFGDYPLTDYTRLLAEAVSIVHPRIPTAEALRRLGHGAYPRFANSTMGKIAVGVFLENVERLVAAAARSYRYVTNAGVVTPVQVGDNHWHWEARGFRGASPAFMVGINEGLLLHHKLAPNVRIRDLREHDWDLCIRWEEPGSNP